MPENADQNNSEFTQYKIYSIYKMKERELRIEVIFLT